MIHTDVDIAGIGQFADDQFQHGQFGSAIGQRIGSDLTLHLEHVGQVRVVVHRETLRRQVQHLVQGDRHGLRRLVRQAVDQIEIDGTEAAVAGGVHDVGSEVIALNAVDGTLHPRIEVLDTETDTVEAQSAQRGDVIGLGGARVDLDREFAPVVATQCKALTQRSQQALHVRHAQIRGRAATEMKLLHRAAGVEQPRLQLDLVLEPMQVGLGTGVVGGDHLVAGTVETHSAAEWHMHVDRQWLTRPIRARHRIAVVGGCKVGVELRRSRIRGVTRPVDAIAAQHLRVELQCR